MKVRCPNCGEPGYLRMVEDGRKWDEESLQATIQYFFAVKHSESESCELKVRAAPIEKDRRYK